jgi:hypothetical protein
MQHRISIPISRISGKDLSTSSVSRAHFSQVNFCAKLFTWFAAAGEAGSPFEWLQQCLLDRSGHRRKPRRQKPPAAPQCGKLQLDIR